MMCKLHARAAFQHVLPKGSHNWVWVPLLGGFVLVTSMCMCTLIC